MEQNDLARRMANLARELQESRDLQTTMEHAVELADKNIPDCDGAAISLVHRGREMETPAATDEAARKVLFGQTAQPRPPTGCRSSSEWGPASTRSPKDGWW